MRKYTYLTLTAALVLTTFTTVTYTSCKKDKCKKVTCSNGGTCKDGNCLCPTGYAGKSCESQAKDMFAKNYKGDGTDTDGDKYPGNTLSFKAGEGITDMKLSLLEENGLIVREFDVKLESASTYSIVTKLVGEIKYTGSGTISESTASLKLKVEGATTFEIDFPNMTAQ